MVEVGAVIVEVDVVLLVIVTVVIGTQEVQKELADGQRLSATTAGAYGRQVPVIWGFAGAAKAIAGASANIMDG